MPKASQITCIKIMAKWRDSEKPKSFQVCQFFFACYKLVISAFRSKHALNCIASGPGLPGATVPLAAAVPVTEPAVGRDHDGASHGVTFKLDCR